MKYLDNVVALLLLVTIVFLVVYILTISADAEYAVQQERQKILFNNLEEMRR